MKDEDRKRLRQAMLKVVDTQLRDGDPPETAETLRRLRDLGHDEQECREMIAGAVVEVTIEVMRGHEYDHQRYLTLLNRLPKLPWE
jgi:hypothetical protein